MDRSRKGADVLRWMQKPVEEHGAPEYIRSENGLEFIAKIVQDWLRRERIKTIYIEPGRPWQNGYVESFHGRFRDECLNREQLWTLTEARVVVNDYRREYNQVRPHSKLGYLSPAQVGRGESAFPVLKGLSPFLHGEWTKRAKTNNIKPAQKLTLQVVQKSEPGHQHNLTLRGR